MVIGVGIMLYIAWLAKRNEFEPDYYNPMEIAGLYWHFVDIVWIFLYPLLYLVDRNFTCRCPLRSELTLRTDLRRPMSEVTHAVATGAHRTDKHASSNQDPHGEFHVSMATYNIIFIWLMVLLVVTVVAAFIPSAR